jgi:cyclopropane-fatty-acyl-phospholipid synthase
VNQALIGLAESGWLPDWLVRAGIRSIVASRRRELLGQGTEARFARKQRFLEELRQAPIAVATHRANEQHYEVAPAFFELVLGPRMKYSTGLWEAGVDSLAHSEDKMLAATCERAGLADGMRVLDLGCGWGSLTLWIAEHFRKCDVLGMSNSKLQREFILRRAAELGLPNVDVVTADVNDFDLDRHFDRVLSVEMFEHVSNHARLLARIARWLAPEGRLFVHHFCHRDCAYPYVAEDDDDWMARHFFTGGIMPSEDLLLRNQRDLEVESQWRVSGLHYEKTSRAWLANLDARSDAVLRTLQATAGESGAPIAVQRWRLFFIACAELFGSGDGGEWFVTHVRMAPRRSPTA